MKKIRHILASIALIITISGVFGFNVHAKFGTGNLWIKVGTTCLLDTTCKLTTSGGLECEDVHYLNSDCDTQPENDKVVTN